MGPRIALAVALSVSTTAARALEAPDRTFKGHSRGILSLAVSTDGRFALTGSEDLSLILWDVRAATAVRTFTGHDDYIFAAAISPDSRYVLSGSQDGTLKLWDAGTGKRLREFKGAGKVFAAAFTPDGRRFVSGSRDKTLLLWDAHTGAKIRTFWGHAEPVVAAAISPDGRRLLSGSQDNTAKLWDLETGRQLRAFEGHSHWVTSVAFSKDGRRALTGSFDKTLKLWDAETGKLLRTFEGHTNAVLGVALSPDGKRALSGGEDKGLRLWDTATGEAIRIFRGHPGDLCCVAFSPDGREVYTASDDATLSAWSVDRASAPATPQKTPAAVPIALERLGRTLFFDKRLSADGTVGCVSCHDPKKGWTDQSKVSTGIGGRKGTRNAPTVVDAFRATLQTWDGRAATLEEQAAIALTHPDEMGSTKEKTAAAVAGIPGYRPLFKAAYGDEGVSFERIVRALAGFERTLTAGKAPFDRYNDGETAAMSQAAVRGRDLFFGKATCFACHSSALLSDSQFHNIGVGKTEDPGRFAITKAPRDKGAFKTPTARNLTRTFPYMHDGSLKTLEEVVEFYDRGGDSPNNFDFEVKPLGLTAAEKKDLLRFLEALDAGPVVVSVPKLP